MRLDKDISEVIFTHEEIVERVHALAKKISEDYKNEEVLVVGILTGSVPFLAELLQGLDLNCNVDFIKCSSYEGDTSTGTVVIKKDLADDPRGKNILLVEDIVDTGLTVSCLVSSLISRGAKSVKVAALLDKPARREYKVTVDYSCFDCPDKFIVGFGLDYNQYYRNLPYIGALKPEAIAAHQSKPSR